ncbi:MAG: PEP-CTERM sorting domain-containing protein [Bryobacteraceae bacterium]|nr:PEP-CTERM sorting domain-containing protein [Bryobacteraceae bacterium]
MKRILLPFLLCFAAMLAPAAVIQEYNATRAPGFFYWAAPSGTIGWYWTPSQDFDLQSIETVLNTQGNNINNNFTLTTSLFTDRPAVGGSLIDAHTFNGAGYSGGWTGGQFATPVSVTAGTSYFVGLSGWDQVLTASGGGGVNWVQPTDYPAGSTFDSLFPGYTGTTFDVQMNAGPTPASIDFPILRFVGVVPTSPVPEPSSIIFMLSGVGALSVLALRKR